MSGSRSVKSSLYEMHGTKVTNQIQPVLNSIHTNWVGKHENGDRRLNTKGLRGFGDRPLSVRKRHLRCKRWQWCCTTAASLAPNTCTSEPGSAGSSSGRCAVCTGTAVLSYASVLRSASTPTIVQLLDQRPVTFHPLYLMIMTNP